MQVLPVIERELRASARQSFTYALRVLGVLALLIVLGVFGLNGSIGPEIGGRLFSALHCALFVAVWVLVPVLTADCISRERREGTLPLLFLTDLNPQDIVSAKGLAQGLRAFTLWLAVLPVLTIPLVAGGVGWPEVLMSALINFSSICLATSAGLLGSSLARVSNRALALALCLAASLLIGLLIFLPFVVIGVSGVNFQRFFWTIDPGHLGPGIVFTINAGDMWQRFLSASRIGPWPVLRGYSAVAMLSLLFLASWVLLAAWRVRRVWREEPPSARVQWLHKTLFTPVLLQPVLRWWLRWQLRRNPIGWLEQRSWSGRLVVWSWFAVVICIYSSLFSNLSLYQRAFHSLQSVMASLLAGSIALSAAGSFRRERETGVLELLLVSPITEWQIIAGRVLGLWMQFLPAMVLLVSVWLYSATFLSTDNELTAVLVYGVAFVALPVIGLYFSLAKNNIIISLLWTLLSGVAVPAAIGRIVALWYGPDIMPEIVAQTAIPCCLQLFIALMLTWRLHYSLKYRKFAFSA